MANVTSGEGGDRNSGEGGQGDGRYEGDSDRSGESSGFDKGQSWGTASSLEGDLESVISEVNSESQRFSSGIEGNLESVNSGGEGTIGIDIEGDLESVKAGVFNPGIENTEKNVPQEEDSEKSTETNENTEKPGPDSPVQINGTEITGGTQLLEYHTMYKSEFNAKMNEMRADPEQTLQAIEREQLINRIAKNNTLEALTQELRDPDDDPEKLAPEISKLMSEDRMHYLDSSRAKGFVQEEMLRSVLGENFDVSSKTHKAEHEDGTVTYTDIVAENAKQDININGVLIRAGENLSIESKAGNEKYLARQIDHISKQLEGMDKDSHRMLVVTADYERMSNKDKERLHEVLNEQNATMTVLPYYAEDLTNMLMHMDIPIDPEENEASDSDVVMTDSDKTAGTEAHRNEHADNNEETEKPEENEQKFFDFLKNDPHSIEESEETEGRAEKTESEKQLDKDRAAVEKLLEDDKELKDLNEEEYSALINVSVIRAAELHYPDADEELLEELHKSVSFADISETALDNMITEQEAKYIQGYYMPNGQIKINTEAYDAGVDEALVIIDHEALHKLAQHKDEEGNTIKGMTGLKRNDLNSSYHQLMRYSNTGMNEGVTEMYAARDMEETTPEREENSYVYEVEVMQKYESFAGEEMLHNAYMSGSLDEMQDDFNSIMGMGQFDSLCRKMDEMWMYETSGDFRMADIKHEELDRMLEEYRREKENMNDGSDTYDNE